MRGYSQLIGTHATYIFFHEISKEAQQYPIFAIEVVVLGEGDAVQLNAFRDVVMLNTAGINNLQFDTVLTAPRACRFQNAAASISAIEHFLQAKYSVSERFMFTGNFRPLIKDELPTIRYRIGLQAIEEEDRRILDYSELITNLDTGGGRKFIEMINRYVEGSVANTADAVDEDFKKKYPYKSIERLAPQHLTIPLRLNDKQKRILTAVENQSNEIIVVDGPPGTGKSYTITMPSLATESARTTDSNRPAASSGKVPEITKN